MNSLVKRLIVACCMIFIAAHYSRAQDEIKLGTLGHTLPFIQVDVAEANGWLNNSQLNTKILSFKTGKDCGTALQNGELDAAILSADYAITGQGQGQAIKQLMVLDRVPGWILVVSKKHSNNITSPAALKGRNIGVTSPGSATDVLLTYLLSKQGIARNEFTPVRAGIETLPDVMRQGGIDAGMVLEPYGTKMLNDGDAVILVDFRSLEQVQKYLGSTYTGTCLLVRQDVLERKKNGVQQLVNALVWTNKWLQTASADDVQKILPREYTPDPELWKKSYLGYKDVFSPDGKNDINGLNTVVASLVAFGTLKSQGQVNVGAIHDDSFWLAANQLPVPPPSARNTGAGTSASSAGTTGKIVFGVVLLLIVIGLAALVMRSRTARAG